jgi:hypothetical protein
VRRDAPQIIHLKTFTPKYPPQNNYRKMLSQNACPSAVGKTRNETITETLGVKFILMEKARSACAAHPQDEPYQARQHTICCYDFKFVL